MTDWQPLTLNDSYVIAASDGVFEKLSPQDICDILWKPFSHFITEPELNSSCSYSLADCIVNTSFRRGSMDNMAAVVIPLRAPVSLETFEDRSYTSKKHDYLAVGDQRQIYEKLGDSLFLSFWSSLHYCMIIVCNSYSYDTVKDSKEQCYRILEFRHVAAMS